MALNCWASICSLCIGRMRQELSVVTCFLKTNLGKKILAFWKVVLSFFFIAFIYFHCLLFLTDFRERERERREAELRAQQVKNAMTTWHFVCYLPTADTLGEGNGNPLQYSCLERIPWTEEPVGLQSMGLQRVELNWVTNTFTDTLPQGLETKIMI